MLCNLSVNKQPSGNPQKQTNGCKDLFDTVIDEISIKWLSEGGKQGGCQDEKIIIDSYSHTTYLRVCFQ